MFIPQGLPLPALSTMKLPQLAAVLDRVASHGVEEFYNGNVSEEIAVTVGLYDPCVYYAFITFCTISFRLRTLFVTFDLSDNSIPDPGHLYSS